MATFDLSILLEAKNKSTSTFRQVSEDMKNLSKRIVKVSVAARRMGAAMKAAGNKMKDVGKTLSTKVTAPIAAIGALAVRSTLSFEQSMNKVSAVTLATGKTLEEMEELARKMGSTTAFSASQAAEAMTFLAQAGLTTDEVMGALPDTLSLAAAGGLELAQAADIATNVMAGMGLKVKDLAKVNDVLALAQARSNTNILELSEAMKPIAGTASTLGVGITELTALLGKMADTGQKGGIAGTLLRNAMLKLVKPTNATAGTLKELGINLSDFVTKGGKIQNFTGLVEKLSKKGATTGQIFKIFGERGARAVLDLQKAGGPAIRKLTKELEDSEGTAKEMQKRMQKGLPGAMAKLKSATESLLITIGKKMAPVLIKVGEKLIKMVEFFESLDDSTQDTILIIASLVAALGPLLILVGTLTTAFGAMSAALSPVALVVLAVIAVVAIIITVFVKWEKMSFKLKAALFVLIGPIILLVQSLKLLQKAWEFFFGGDNKKEIKIDADTSKLNKFKDINSTAIGKLISKSQAEIGINVKPSGPLTAEVESVTKKKGNPNVSANVFASNDIFTGLVEQL